MTTWKKHDEIFRRISDSLLVPRTISQARLKLSELLEQYKVPLLEAEIIRKHFEKELFRKIPIRWPSQTVTKSLITTAKRLDPILVGIGLMSNNGYFGLKAALYCEGIINQLSKNIFLINERTSPSKVTATISDNLDLEPFFIRDPRITS